ncbi:MAG: ABC transporter substrate-binding protein [Chloroflexota bacterium]
MRSRRMLALGASLLVLLSACGTGGGSKPTIKIGSDGFYESQLVAEMYAQVLEKAGYTVERSLALGARKVTSPALEGGQIDLKPEYIGSGLGYYDASKPSGDADANAAALQEILSGKGGGITVLDYSPGEDTNAFVVRPDTAAKFSLTTMSDLAAVQDELTWGLPPECETNPLCAGALTDTYGIDFPPANLEALAACDAPIAEALQNGAVDVAELCSTQPAIAQFGFVVLEDDKQTQPAENLAPIVRNDFLAKLSSSDKTAFEKLLNDVSAKLTTEVLTELGVEVAVNQKDVADVARDFLTEQGLL